MQKLILLSVLIATFVIPHLLERRADRRAGFPDVLRAVFVFTAIYVVALVVVYPRLF